MKPTILVTLGHYLPGFKSGGPLRSIVNLVEYLGDDFAFRILTRDRDLGDAAPYRNVPIDRWHRIGRAEVFHASPKNLSATAVSRLIAETPHDLLYINSLLAPPCGLYPLLARRTGRLPRRPLVVAPRGIFSAGALSLKSRKKRSFFVLTRVAGLYRDALWHASSEFERADVHRVMGKEASVSVASDLPLAPRAGVPAARTGAAFELVFLARIAPMKNLHFALEALAHVRQPVRFSILGPEQDHAYWHRCREAIAALPGNVEVVRGGPVPPEEVPEILAAHDLMILPSLGENFGHSIAEALAVGTPVLISDRTPWRDLARHGLGCELPLDNPRRFAEEIDARATAPRPPRADVQAGYARLAQIEAQKAANRALFEAALS